MNFIDYIRDKLFPSKSNDKLPFVQEQIKRSTSDTTAFEEWKESMESKQVLEYIHHQFKLSKNSEEDMQMIRVLNLPSSSGIMFRMPQGMSALSFQHLFDYLKEAVMGLNYYSYTSDRKHFNRQKGKDSYVETIERHYLKPSFKELFQQNYPIDQLYGNVLLELFKIDNQPTHLKIQANSYHDSKYKPAMKFDALVERICLSE